MYPGKIGEEEEIFFQFCLFRV